MYRVLDAQRQTTDVGHSDLETPKPKEKAACRRARKTAGLQGRRLGARPRAGFVTSYLIAPRGKLLFQSVAAFKFRVSNSGEARPPLVSWRVWGKTCQRQTRTGTRGLLVLCSARRPTPNAQPNQISHLPLLSTSALAFGNKISQGVGVRDIYIHQAWTGKLS